MALSFLVFLVIIAYLWMCQKTEGFGFPLDDAWIHQTYARNLGNYGEWAFLRGSPSAGSTAPLWTFMLAIGYWLKLDHFAWTFILGGGCLLGMGLLGWKTAELFSPSHAGWFGLLQVGEWHLVWAAVSGMETLLFSGLILAVLYLLARERLYSWWIGVLVGISIWVRPDGLTLLGPVLLVAATLGGTRRDKSVGILKILGGFSCVFVPYLIFNQVISGAIFPTTFYAKQAEYAVMQQEPLLNRVSSVFSLPLVGAGLMLLPGFIYAGYSFFKKKNWWGIAAVLWWVGFNMLYVVRLPVTYQHGRYLIPAMPVFWLVGWIGSVWLIGWLRRTGRIGRLVSFGSIAILILIWAAFLGLGARTYAQDTAIINTEMVAASQWINANTPKDTVIGAHDIGALGYFGGRKILDLAGLISPEVIPFIRDERMLISYLQGNNATFLMTFPGWYPSLVQNMQQVFITKGFYSPVAGGENMAVFSLQEREK